MDRHRHATGPLLAPPGARPARMGWWLACCSNAHRKMALASVALAAMLTGLTPALPASSAQCRSAPEPGIDWQDCRKNNLMLPDSNLERANLFDVDFSMTDLSGVNLNGANLEKATLVRAWLTGGTAENANFSRVEGYRTGFTDVIANGANFSNAEMQRADFSGAKLRGANFAKAELGRALFTEATLANTRFSLANLSRADFSKAHFDGPVQFDRAFMFLTRIEGLDLSRAEGLDQAQIDLACGNAKTRLPDGLVAPTSWPCEFD